MSKGEGPSDLPDYLTMIEDEHAEYLVDCRLAEGRDPVGMFIAHQPPDHYPSETPTSTYDLQLAIGTTPIRARVDVGSRPFEVRSRRNTFVVSPPNAGTQVDLYDDLQVLGIGLPAQVVHDAWDDVGRDGAPLAALFDGARDDKIIGQIARELWKETRRDRGHGTLFVDAAVMTIATRLVMLSAKAPVSAPARPATRLDARTFGQLVDFVDANLDAPLRMQALADLAGLPVHTFARAFKARTGRPPYQWVIDRRVERARELLTGTDLPLASVAYACGFSSQAHMTTLVGERLGLSPGRLRNGA